MLNKPQIWFQVSNMNQGGGGPPDWDAMWARPEDWEEAASHIGVHLWRGPFMRKQPVDSLLRLRNWERKHMIAMAINSTGAFLYDDRQRNAFVAECKWYNDTFKPNGIVPRYISMQSILSKTRLVEDPETGKQVDYPIEKRIADICQFTATVRQYFPNVRFGLIDASIAHGRDNAYDGEHIPYVNEIYRWLIDDLAKVGESIDYSHCDISSKALIDRRYGVGFEELRAFQERLNRHGISFGLYAKSRSGGMHSNERYFLFSQRAIQGYFDAGGWPRDYIVTSWFPYPDATIPDWDEANKPLTYVVRENGRLIDELYGYPL